MKLYTKLYTIKMTNSKESGGHKSGGGGAHTIKITMIKKGK